MFACTKLNQSRYDATGTQDHSDHECQSQGVRSCGECLAAGPHCAWCTEETFLEVGQPTWERCDTARQLLRRGCPLDRLEDPKGSTVLLKNKKITFHPKEQRQKRWHKQVTQLQPQSVLMHLRPGEPQSLEVKFKRVEDYPIDLYYLMDLSFSMEDDLPNVKKLGADLMEEMRNTTSDFRMGFGAFVDKTVMPYISTAKGMLANPCKRTKPWPCAPPFTFRHVLSLTANGSRFAELVGGQRISGNLDSPEGGLDALMQAAMCEEQIGWRNVTRLLVFSTDAGFHFAGDGKLGGIVLPNDGKCHLEENVYTRGNAQDYPSPAHVAEALRRKNIQIIFAVTEEVTHLYEGLRSVFPKCAVGTLSNNSHNILQIIVEAYNALTSEVVMENSKLPPGYSVSYTSRCKGGGPRHGEQGKRCSDISVGDEVSFNVSITAPRCVTASQRPSRVIIKPQGYGEEVEVLLSPICECSCQKDVVPHSPSCSHGNGTLECGACRCNQGRVGAFCECDREESGEAVESHLCRRGNASEVCSGHGECVCGRCVCGKSSKKPNNYGQFCECSDFGCDQHRGMQCGGTECPSGPNVILITAVLSGSVVVLGVALLLLWKLLTSIHDRREFARFQRELEQRRWNRRDNPIYKSAITTVVNPKYKEQ
ncbi:integrin beta-1-like [Stegastes partitus]|uniref:Integrin beta n=1 Tax=Stegastes partitus TaxID=144197 RepID=A0A9Y4N245_9TELE|nr:PREDICTED: integrin beta-1-like [Stegastes partitus]